PGGGRKGLRARKDTNLRARSPPLQGDTLIPHPRLTPQPGFSVCPSSRLEGPWKAGEGVGGYFPLALEGAAF
ncbi:MAG: hypothetical protein ACK4G4_11225, partial [Thermus sp.]|uniref:hypothetical protein n=1 Tax=Thermus sp. TaxID=275 RepID=UPI003919D228